MTCSPCSRHPAPDLLHGQRRAVSQPGDGLGAAPAGRFPGVPGRRGRVGAAPRRRGAAAGQVLGMFPEGTRSKGKGLKPAKTGVARLALAVGCPIVPVALHGPQYMFKRFPRRTTVQVTFGEPIYPDRQMTRRWA